MSHRRGSSNKSRMGHEIERTSNHCPLRRFSKLPERHTPSQFQRMDNCFNETEQTADTHWKPSRRCSFRTRCVQKSPGPSPSVPLGSLRLRPYYLHFCNATRNCQPAVCLQRVKKRHTHWPNVAGKKMKMLAKLRSVLRHCVSAAAQVALRIGAKGNDWSSSLSHVFQTGFVTTPPSVRHRVVRSRVPCSLSHVKLRPYLHFCHLGKLMSSYHTLDHLHLFMLRSAKLCPVDLSWLAIPGRIDHVSWLSSRSGVPGCSTKGGKGTTTPMIQAEWNMSQWPDLPQQASLVTGQILQQLMNMAKNAESRISTTEQLVRNQFDILSRSPGGQLQPGTVPALLQHAVQHRDMLERIAEERAVQQSQEQGSNDTAIEAYQQLSECHDQIIDEHEKLEAKIADMEAKFNKLLEAQIKLSKKMEEFQTDRSRLIETNKRLVGQIQQHESTIVLLNTHMDKTLTRVQELESKFNLIVGNRSSSSGSQEDQSTLLEDVETIHNNLRVMFAKMAITEEELDASQVREAHRDQRLLGLLQELSSKVTSTEGYAYNMNEMMHALHAVNAGPNFPDLPAITHGYW
eukprot:4224582-Amphidinium_carterae.1